MKLAFIILAHNDACNVLRLITRLTGDDDLVTVHWDKNNPLDFQALAKRELSSDQLSNLHFCPRFAVQWGRWSMVEATLSALATSLAADANIDYVILLSGADYPLQSISALKAFLSQQQGKEFIECVDPEINPWVVQGLVKERYCQYHWFSWRSQRRLFDFSTKLQKKLGINRKLPENLKAHFGSQWWALTAASCQKILAISQRRAIRRFFNATWVPDELFFQTLIAATVPKEQIAGTGLTFYHFDNAGKPLVFYNDHLEFLCRQNYFFARKLSPEAKQLRKQLDDYIDHNPNKTKPTSINKYLDDYQKFSAIQWRGIPNRRVIGKQNDAWYGDLEWNTQPYFVILSNTDAKLNPLQTALNQLPGIRCFGELFHGSYIDYSLLGHEHPFYPANKPALRNMKRPNFLVDLLTTNSSHFVGFILRLPSDNEMEKVVLYDPNATLIFIQPENNPINNGMQQIDWSGAFDNMIMQDHMQAARKAGKAFMVVKTKQQHIPQKALRQILSQLFAISNTTKVEN